MKGLPKVTSLLFALLSALLFTSFSKDANAQSWVFCNNCITEADFNTSGAQAASSLAADNFHYLAVGNTTTGIFYYVEVYNPPADGQVPRAIRETYSSQHYRARTGQIVSSVRANEAELAQFQAILSINRNGLLTSAPRDTVGFESFHGAQTEMVGSYLWSAMTAKYPR